MAARVLRSPVRDLLGRRLRFGGVALRQSSSVPGSDVGGAPKIPPSSKKVQSFSLFPYEDFYKQVVCKCVFVGFCLV